MQQDSEIFVIYKITKHYENITIKKEVPNLSTCFYSILFYHKNIILITKTTNIMISLVLQQLQNLELITDYFFCFNIQSGKGRFIGWYTPDLENYLLDKGFFKIDYLYADDDSQHEYQNGSIQIVLSEQK